MSLPALMHVHDLVRLTGWAPKKVRRFIDSNGLATREAGNNGARVVDATTLQARMPVVYRALDAKWDAMQAGREFSRRDFSDLDDEDEQ